MIIIILDCNLVLIINLILMQKTKCLICGTEFMQRTNKHKFCSRKCFVIYYRRQAKIKKFPHYLCSKCGKKTQLTFHPKDDIKKWERFKCPFCKFNKKGEIIKEMKKIKEKIKIKKIIYS